MTAKDGRKLLALALLLVLAVVLIRSIDRAGDREESELVREAVRDAALTCYAVEGAYPPSVDYLRDHYELAYDEARYYVTYEAFAVNRMPDIWVTERGAEGP